MTLHEFNALDEMEQAEAVWDSVFIADREDPEDKILLYQRDAFYIEVYYHKEYNVIRRLRSFLSTLQLSPYLDKMDLNDKF